MTVRTRTETVTFVRPFVLGDIDEVLAPGDYQIETDEERIEGVSFLAYRRVSARIHLPAANRGSSMTRTVELSPRLLDAALLNASTKSADPA